MNPVASLARTFPCDADSLFAVLEKTADWCDGEPGELIKSVPAQQLTFRIEVGGEATRAMLVLSPGGASPADGTQLQVLHTRFASDADRDRHAALWEARLERVAALLE